MRFSLGSLVRSIVLLAVISQVVAIGVGRSVGPATSGGSWRPTTGDTRYAPISGRLIDLTRTHGYRLDRDSGRIDPCPTEKDEALDHVAVSRWADEQGERLAIGRWTSKRSDAQNVSLEEYGLALLTWPGGQRLGRMTMDILPTSPACWVPGDSERVVFSAGDGQLYALRLPEPGDAEGLSQSNPVRPRPISWETAEPGLGRPFVSDPTWPDIAGLGGRIVVSFSHLTRVHGELAYLSARLWWLTLDRFGTAIVDAGPLNVSDPAAPLSDDMAERCPSLALRPDGSVLIGYLTRGDLQSHWDLRVAPVEIDAQTGAPRVRRERSTLVAGGCLPTAPVFSTDGRRVSFLKAFPAGLNGEVTTREIADSSLAHR